jgi:hypothetical protein
LYFRTKHQQLILTRLTFCLPHYPLHKRNEILTGTAQKASLVKAKEKIVQKEYEKALLIKDLKKQLEQKENETASLIKANELAERERKGLAHYFFEEPA